MANFAADGFLIFPEFIPDEINAECMREIDEKLIPSHYMTSGMPLSDLWPDSKGFGTLFRLPQVQGLMRSLVGPEPRYDHHAFHKVGPQHADGQIWHADNIIDTREHFDVQLFYFPHDTPREMGGTMFLPGSQYPPGTREQHRALSELPGAGSDGVQGGDARGRAPRHLALRPAEPHRHDALHVQAPHQPDRAAEAPLEHGRPDRSTDRRTFCFGTTAGTATTIGWSTAIEFGSGGS